jgi:hypothetical protein
VLFYTYIACLIIYAIVSIREVVLCPKWKCPCWHVMYSLLMLTATKTWDKLSFSEQQYITELCQHVVTKCIQNKQQELASNMFYTVNYSYKNEIHFKKVLFIHCVHHHNATLTTCHPLKTEVILMCPKALNVSDGVPCWQVFKDCR